MKYLKLFLEHDEYYFSISDNEFSEAEERGCKIDSKYADTIKSLIKSGWEIKYDLNKSLINSIEIQGDDYYDNFTIYKTTDEWFFVMKKVRDIMSGPYNDYYIHYKCDQFDGLLKFLKDYRVI